ncbi:MAG: 16S rRNA (adenine(1518)-N(6)/adenine(1519)-N(6))-dimethyltransferase RsmA [Thermoleophilia bacterium]
MNLTPMERLRRSGVTPDRSLGQNFLIDPNILDVIEKTAGLGSDDSVLEVGPGLGVLTERLVGRCALVHCVELDRRLAAMLVEEFGGLANFRLHQADAMKFPLGELDPQPAKFVSNLPYNVAAPLVMKSLEELAGARLWCLMLQKEIADRFFAATGAANYGGISVMVQLLCLKLSSRHISGSVFYPRPRVRSSLLAFRRREGESFTTSHFRLVRSLVAASFSHRRKTLANSLVEAESELALPVLSRIDTSSRKKFVEKLLGDAGIASNARPQELAPGQYEELAMMISNIEDSGNA